jgi:N utilization substance protein B
MKPIMDDNFTVPKVYKDSEDKALSRICLENSFEQKRELAKEFVDKTLIGIVIELLMDTIILKWPEF